jgi:hypothetical protein
MKSVILLWVLGACFLSCANPAYTAARPSLSLKDAERILGEPAYRSESDERRQSKALNYSQTYKAAKEDPQSGKTGALYFLLQEYDELALAQERYRSIKAANQANGIKTITDLGDEAYFHSDKQNFYYIMIRKGPRVITMKVNKITSHTSLEEFNRIARKIAADM